MDMNVLQFCRRNATVPTLMMEIRPRRQAWVRMLTRWLIGSHCGYSGASGKARKGEFDRRPAARRPRFGTKGQQVKWQKRTTRSGGGRRNRRSARPETVV